MPPKIKKNRAKNLPGSIVGKQRHSMYQQAIEHISISLEKGFYLEAITLIESIISDRLESRLSFLMIPDSSFQTLGALIELIRTHETDDKLKNLVINELDGWRKLRNNSIHEMVKLKEGDNSTWENRVQQLPQIAKSGLILFRKVSNRVQIICKREYLEANIKFP